MAGSGIVTQAPFSTTPKCCHQVPSASTRRLGTQGAAKRIMQGGHSSSEGFHPAQGMMPASAQPVLERCLLNFKELDGRVSQGQSQALTSSRSSQVTCDSPITATLISPTPLLTPGAGTGGGILLQPAACPGGQATPSRTSQAKNHKIRRRETCVAKMHGHQSKVTLAQSEHLEEIQTRVQERTRT